MGRKRDDAASGAYVNAVRGGADTPEKIAPLVGQTPDRARRSLNALVNLKLLDRSRGRYSERV
jgi:DNA-binding IclR family transcriptional regulator